MIYELAVDHDVLPKQIDLLSKLLQDKDYDLTVGGVRLLESIQAQAPAKDKKPPRGVQVSEREYATMEAAILTRTVNRMLDPLDESYFTPIERRELETARKCLASLAMGLATRIRMTAR